MNKDFSVKILPVYFWIFMLIFSSLAVLRGFYSANFFMDTLEHIHASWLVSEGKIPYRDFFEHHNPLLWYLFAPFTKLFYRDVNIIYIARFIAISGYLLTLYLIYKLANSYCNNRNCGYLPVLFILCIATLWLDIQNLRPDIFMYIFILTAIYCMFNYIDTLKQKYLCYSYISWIIAFLFLQKAIIYGIGFAVITIWFLYKKKIPFSHFFNALIIPIILLISFFAILYYNDLLKKYYECNFTFNLIVKNNYGNHRTGFLSIFNYQFFFTMLLTTMTFRANDKSIILFTMGIISYLFVIKFAPHPQYYFMTIALFVILIAPTLKSWYKKNNYLYIILSTIFLILSFHNLNRFNDNIKQNISLIDYVIKSTQPSDKLLNGFNAFNLFNPDTDYYWFGFHNIVILADLYTERHFDYNEQIKKYKPKYIFMNSSLMNSSIYDRIAFSNSEWFRNRNGALIKKASKGYKKALNKLVLPKLDYWEIDNDYIKKHYKFINKYDKIELWQRIDN